MFTQPTLGQRMLLSAFAATALFAATQIAQAGDSKAGRGRVVATDGQGNAATASGGAFKTPNARGVRGSKTVVNQDGSAQHTGGFAAQGAKGKVTSRGSTTRNADGTFSGGRTTKAVGANGNSASATSTWDSTNGYNRNVTCKDAGGNVIACPR